jgi:allantoin racemase
MHIRIINPVTTTEWAEAIQQTYSAMAHRDTRLSVVSLDWGPASIESRYDDVLSTPGIVSRALEAEQEGVDAIIINCMNDPGLYPAREVVSIPVVGPAEASMHLAAMLGHRFTIITTLADDIPAVEELIIRYGMGDRAASVRAIDVPVLDLEKDEEATIRLLIDVGEKAVRQDSAHVLIPGCTLMAGTAPRVQVGLSERGCGVPVLDPPAIALKLAESLVSLGLSHSKRTYPSPGDKEILWPVPQAFAA